jgi:hypothetical protein
VAASIKGPFIQQSPYPQSPTMPASSTAATKKALKEALTVRPPYCSGTCPIPADELVLYYGQSENARCVHHNLLII